MLARLGSVAHAVIAVFKAYIVASLSFLRRLLPGLTAGAIAAIIAAIVSLPLHSPLDSVFNTATVVVAALAVGFISGLLWSWFSTKLLWFLGALAAIFVLALVIAFVGNTQLDRVLSYMVPLAAIVVVACAVLTPLLASFFLRPAIGLLRWTPVVAVIVALVIGFGLITQGDAKSGELTLPPAPAASESESQSAEAPANTDASTASGTELIFGSEAYAIVEGSEITFKVEEELGRAPIRFDAVISSTGLTGVANLGDEPSVVALDLHSLASDQQYRDRYIRDTLFADTPEAVVTVDQLPDLPQGFLDGEETTGQLNGSLQIGESTTPLVFEVTARKDGETINILGKTQFTWDGLGLTKPTAKAVVYLADEVSVEVLLVARAAP